MQSQRKDRFISAGKQSVQFTSAEEVDGKPLFWSFQIQDGEATISVSLRDFMSGSDIGANGVDPNAEQTSGRQTFLR